MLASVPPNLRIAVCLCLQIGVSPNLGQMHLHHAQLTHTRFEWRVPAPRSHLATPPVVLCRCLKSEWLWLCTRRLLGSTTRTTQQPCASPRISAMRLTMQLSNAHMVVSYWWNVSYDLADASGTRLCNTNLAVTTLGSAFHPL
jgi:hypothetical protein